MVGSMSGLLSRRLIADAESASSLNLSSTITQLIILTRYSVMTDINCEIEKSVTVLKSCRRCKSHTQVRKFMTYSPRMTE